MGKNMMTIVFGVILIAIAFIMFPVVIEGAEETRLATNISQYTGLSSLVKIGPTLAFVFLILGGLVSGGFGVYGIVRGSRSSRSRSR